jgi:hypothetical protein
MQCWPNQDHRDRSWTNLAAMACFRLPIMFKLCRRYLLEPPICTFPYPAAKVVGTAFARPSVAISETEIAMSHGKPTSPIELQECLRGVNYPAGKETLLDMARRNGAPPEVVDMIDKLPDEDFDSPKTVTQALAHTA